MKRNILFLCGFNAGRSIVAESLLNHLAGDQFTAHSAGEEPSPAVHPDALRLLETKGHKTEGLHTKSWQTFLTPGAPRIDLAITLCDNANGEMCMLLSETIPVAHWDTPDPALAATPEDRARVFDEVYQRLERLIMEMRNLPGNFSGRQFANAVTRIGHTEAGG